MTNPKKTIINLKTFDEYHILMKNNDTGTCTPKTKVPQKPQGQLKGNIYGRATYNIKLLLINDA